MGGASGSNGMVGSGGGGMPSGGASGSTATRGLRPQQGELSSGASGSGSPDQPVDTNSGDEQIGGSSGSGSSGSPMPAPAATGGASGSNLGDPSAEAA